MKPSAHIALATGIITALVAFAAPGSAAAQAVSSNAQVLPPGGSGCTTLPINAIAAHVVDGALHSFDVTIGDASYTAILAQVGGEGVPFNYMTRFNHGSGMVRHHIDLQTTPIRSSLPVSIVLLSSPQGSPTCLTTISFSVSPSGAVLAPGASTGVTNIPQSTSTGGSTSSGSSGGSSVTGSTGTPGTVVATSSATTAGSPVQSGFVARLQNMCTGNNALQLWFLLLAIYVVIAALTALARPPLSQRSVALPLVLILVPLVLLLGLWYFVPSCRAAGWVPAVSVIIAIAALLVAFRDQNPAVKIIPLPPAKGRDASKTAVPAIAHKAPVPVVQNQQKPQQKGK